MLRALLHLFMYCYLSINLCSRHPSVELCFPWLLVNHHSGLTSLFLRCGSLRSGQYAFLSVEELLPWVPEGTTFLPSDSTYDHYLPSFTRQLCQPQSVDRPCTAMKDRCGPVLMVTHREGIRDLCKAAGIPPHKYSTPYCCIARFALDTRSSEVVLTNAPTAALPVLSQEDTSVRTQPHELTPAS